MVECKRKEGGRGLASVIGVIKEREREGEGSRALWVTRNPNRWAGFDPQLDLAVRCAT